jgi:cell division transport system permease protein
MSARPAAPRSYKLPLGHADAARLLPWVLALMAYVAALGAVGLAVAHAALRASQAALSTTMTLEVPAAASPARLRTLLAVLHQTPGIASAHLLDEAATARLLAPWLGPAVPIDGLPVPHLIDLRTDPGRGPDLAALRHELASVVPEARLEDHRALADAMHGAATPVKAVLAAALAAGLTLIGVVAAFAVRAGLAAQSERLELLHLLGAGDRAIARQIAKRWLWLGCAGGAIGAGAAFLTVLALARADAIVRLQASDGAAIAGWQMWGVLVAVAALAGLIAMSSAQITVWRRLARLP